MARIDEGGDLNLVPSGSSVKVAGNRIWKQESGSIARLDAIPKYLKYDFTRMGEPLYAKASGAGAATGTGGDVNIMAWPNAVLNYVAKGTQTIVYPAMTASGLDLGSMDQTATDGIEVRPSILCPHDMLYTVGTDSAFYVEWKFKLGTVAGTTVCYCGFRKQEADNATVTSYTEFASMKVVSGTISTATNKASGGVVATSTTQSWADGETHSLRIRVDGSGVVSYLIDGKTPTVVPTSVTLTSGVKLMPYFFFLQAAGLTTCPIVSLEIGHE